MSDVILRNITKRYTNKRVVKNLNLHINESEFLTLLGPSGCGKSTTLKMIAGLEDITSGELIIEGKKYNKVPARKRQIGMVFQSYALFPHMTVDQNIAFGLKIKRVAKLEIFEKLEWVKKLLHLTGKGKSFPKNLSGGEKQRVALGRSLVLKPKVLLLDEPLSNLDQELRESMTTELKRIHLDVGRTTIYVTHNQMEAMRMSDRIALMKEGELIQCGSPMSIFNKPKNMFVASFIGSPAMNFVQGKIVQHENFIKIKVAENTYFNLERSRSQALSSLVGKEVIAGIRPQQIYYFKDRTGQRHSDSDIEVVTNIVEPLGDRIMIDAKFYNQNMVFLMISESLPNKNEKVRIVIDGRHIHLFDKKNGERIDVGEDIN